MKEIKAYVRRAMSDYVIDALAKLRHLEIGGIAVARLEEFGHADGDGNFARTGTVKVEVVVPDRVVDQVVERICGAARTGAGHPGDGHVYVSDVARGVRIADGREETP